MKKLIIALLLIVFIAANGVFIYARIAAQSPEQNYFNASWRGRVNHYAWLRNLLSLHDYGDAQYDYLGPKNSRIRIEVDAMQGEQISDATMQKVADEAAAVTSKEVDYNFFNLDIPYANAVTDADIDKIAQQYSRTFGSGAQIQLLVLSAKDGENNLLGLTYKNAGIVIFNDALKNFTQSSPDTFVNYQASTILHEFGHQMGLEHNTQADCIMNPKAESSDVARQVAGDVITHFCTLERAQLLELQNSDR